MHAKTGRPVQSAGGLTGMVYGSVLPAKLVLKTTKPALQAGACGESPAYPQDWMCRRRLFWLTPLFVHERFSLDTILFQRVRRHVNH